MHTLLESWNAIRSILQFMLTFTHGPKFAVGEVPKTEFQRTATTMHPIKLFVKEYVEGSAFAGEYRISCDELWLDYVAWCSRCNVALKGLTKATFGIKLTRFNINGVSQAKHCKVHGRVERRRTFNYQAIRESLPDADPGGDADAGGGGAGGADASKGWTDAGAADADSRIAW